MDQTVQSARELDVRLPPKMIGPLFTPARYKVFYGGRGGAKSWGVARALLAQGIQKPLRILCTREIQRTIADSVHMVLVDQIKTLGMEDYYTITDSAIKGMNGTEFFFSGLRSQDAHKLKSYEGVDICWVEEAKDVSKRSWDILVPTIRKEESEIWVTFNPELDTDETYVRFVTHPPKGAVVVFINYPDNPWFPKVLELERLALKERDPVAYDNIWEGKCRSIVEGAIYHNELTNLETEGRFRAIPYDPMLKVHTIWDLGFADSMAVISAQRTASEVRIIGYIEGDHRTLADYVKEIEQKRYVWGTDWLPHDGRAKDYKSGKSAEEILRSLGRNPQIVENLDVESGIKAARLLFPRCFVDVSCERLIHVLRRYRRKINETTGQLGPPVHDENSHGADAFRYLAVSVDQMKNDRRIIDPYAGFRRSYA